MKPYYQDLHAKLYNKDCRSMRELAGESIQCVVTSPPYWGLRKYSGEQELIWDDRDCEHQWGKEMIKHDALRHRPGEHCIVGSEKNPAIHPGNKVNSGFCSLCGAWKGAYGLEPTPEMYIEHTIEILREIRRVLRKDGVVWWNIGDSYATSSAGTRDMEPVTWEENGKAKKRAMTRIDKVPGLKPKDLCLIPFKVAIACQEDGWWVRSVIIWSKPNPMPESVTDRPTESHEYILMLTKSARYYWDAEAVREKYADVTLNDPRVGKDKSRGGIKDYANAGVQNPSDVRERIFNNLGTGRNIRSVWEFPTTPYAKAHFATFPEKLPEICIKAGTPEVGCCSKCGSPYERISERQTNDTRPGRNTGEGKSGTANDPNQSLHQSDLSKYRQQISYETLGWQPTCKCNADKVPGLVLDPFMGAGTTLWVAKKLNRRAIGYEISEEYCHLTVDRLRQQVLL